jgi:hypothetical protein
MSTSVHEILYLMLVLKMHLYLSATHQPVYYTEYILYEYVTVISCFCLCRWTVPRRSASVANMVRSSTVACFLILFFFREHLFILFMLLELSDVTLANSNVELGLVLACLSKSRRWRCLSTPSTSVSSMERLVLC